MLSKTLWWKLDGIRPVPDETNGGWKFDERNNRNCTVGNTKINEDVFVSTVFLGLNHNFSGHGVPILFETLVFGGPLDGHMERYKTWGDAEQGHQKMVDKVRKEMKIIE